MNHFKWLSPQTEEWGVYNDGQVPNTYSCYGDTAMETLLLRVKPIMEELTKLNLTETYSYARVYKNGDVFFNKRQQVLFLISKYDTAAGKRWVWLPITSNYGGQYGERTLGNGGEEHIILQFKGEDYEKVFNIYDLGDEYLKHLAK